MGFCQRFCISTLAEMPHSRQSQRLAKSARKPCGIKIFASLPAQPNHAEQPVVMSRERHRLSRPAFLVGRCRPSATNKLYTVFSELGEARMSRLSSRQG